MKCLGKNLQTSERSYNARPMCKSHTILQLEKNTIYMNEAKGVESAQCYNHINTYLI